MKTLLKGLLLAAVVVGVGLLLVSDYTGAQSRPFVEDNVTVLKAPTHGYSTVVDSSYINSAHPLGTACYSLVSAPTGYWFHLIEVYSQDATGDQAITVRFFDTSTDSTTIMAAPDTIQALASAAELEAAYPIKCVSMSITGIADTEDWKVIGYCKKY